MNFETYERLLRLVVGSILKELNCSGAVQVSDYGTPPNDGQAKPVNVYITFNLSMAKEPPALRNVDGSDDHSR